jgi:hypothetical protein
MDFESGLPALRLDANSATLQPKISLNGDRPISGSHDLLVSAILRGGDAPGWTSVWLPLADNRSMDVRAAIGIRFKARSTVARQFTLMLDSDVYPTPAARLALTFHLAAGTSEYSVYFHQFAYPQKLSQPGGLCSIEAGGTALCNVRSVEVLGRLRALHGFLVPRTNALGALPADTALIQLDDLRLLFDDDLLL